MSVQWDVVEAKARAVRAKYHAQESPVSLYEIARGEGIEIIYFSPSEENAEISGLLDKKDMRIYLNAEESAQRQNFTLAHELAHHFLGHKPNQYGVYRRDSLYEKQKPDKELEADYFAAELLMPRELIAKRKKRYDLTDSDAVILSKLFGVSPSAMRYRLRELARGHKK
jgi:Zn-dependent peptidase ImmA (M78 family)